jgi:hypothetical protein
VSYTEVNRLVGLVRDANSRSIVANDIERDSQRPQPENLIPSVATTAGRIHIFGWGEVIVQLTAELPQGLHACQAQLDTKDATAK